ncbi:MAG: Wzz/FepE/Etk N-terminal domain-containing protein [Actinomycetota bacterium]|nr:Wzz/FepE/Etk N-terminal domain-containing protein [Actinomycetota bacterium]
MTPPSAKRQGGSRGGGRSDSSWQGWQRDQRDDLTLSEVRHILFERRFLVIGCTLFFFVTALTYGLLRQPAYTAEATLWLRSAEGTGAAESFDEVLSGLQESEATRGVSEEAAERAGWEASSFNERLERELVSDEEVEVRFSDSRPEEATRAVNAYVDVFVEHVEELEGRLAGGTVAVDAGVGRYAETPERRSGPNVFLTAVGAGACGLLVGGIGALFLEGRARRWSGSRDAELTLRAPVLGVIPDCSDGLLAGTNSRDEDAERARG